MPFNKETKAAGPDFGTFIPRLKNNIELTLRDRVRNKLGKTGKTLQLSLEKVVYLQLKHSVKETTGQQIALELYNK